MSKRIIQGFGRFVLLFSVLSSALTEEENVPRTLNCSFVVHVGKFSSLINLCSLKRDVCLSVYSDKPSPSVKNIHRYYLINPFGKIGSTSNEHNVSQVPRLDHSTTNCPLQSTSCLVSNVTFQGCNNNQDENEVGVCYNEPPIITADSYGWEGRWKAKPMHPSEPSDAEDLKRSTVIITTQGGPCYYCDDTDLKLTTAIEFYCDERITDHGEPPVIVKKRDPTKSNPKVLLHWQTSAACYQFNPNEKCDDVDFSKICELKTFGCDLGQERKGHRYNVPTGANHSIISRNPSFTYIFGFCAKNVQCSTDEKDVMICKKKGQTSKALAYYSDGISSIARPTGFVMRIEDQQYGSLKAVISFECSRSTTSLRNMTVKDNNVDLPILLTIKHVCFCPDSDCQTDPNPTKSPQSSPKHPPSLGESLAITVAVLVVLTGILLCVKYKQVRVCTRAQVEVQPTNTGGGGCLQEGNEGGSSTNTDASSTYHTPPSSIQSNDTMLSAVSAITNVLGPNPTERTPLLSCSETRESGV